MQQRVLDDSSDDEIIELEGPNPKGSEAVSDWLNQTPAIANDHDTGCNQNDIPANEKSSEQSTSEQTNLQIEASIHGKQPSYVPSVSCQQPSSVPSVSYQPPLPVPSTTNDRHM